MWHSARRYGLALLLTSAGLAANALGPPVLHEFVFFLLLGAIFVSSWYGGLGPGVLATCLSVAGIQFFFLPPLGVLSAERPDDVVRLVLLACLGLGMSVLNNRLRAAEQRSRSLVGAEQASRLGAQKALEDLEQERLYLKEAGFRLNIV